jgi:hypothetical protein
MGKNVLKSYIANMSSMILRWSTSKIVFSDPVKTMSAHGSHFGWRSWSPDTILKAYYPRTIHAMIALNWLTGFREEDF